MDRRTEIFGQVSEALEISLSSSGDFYPRLEDETDSDYARRVTLLAEAKTRSTMPDVKKVYSRRFARGSPSEHGRPSTTDPSVQEWMGYALELETMVWELQAESQPATAAGRNGDTDA